MANSVATPGFLKALRSEAKQIEKYLLKHGFRSEEQSEHEAFGA